jgi:hypothetical protein
MATFDSQSVSALYEHIAEEAERYLREVKVKAKKNKSYEDVHDDHLAKFNLYYYLPTKVESKERLLKELQRLKREPPRASSEAFDADRFSRYYLGWVEVEINRTVGVRSD